MEKVKAKLDSAIKSDGSPRFLLNQGLDQYLTCFKDDKFDINELLARLQQDQKIWEIQLQKRKNEVGMIGK